ncbi:LOW QUALITY PROTEIN: hypothetical protein HID58_091004, partial [Brassica napus]
ISGNARPTIFNCETVCDQRGEVVREIDSADPAEADAHWVALSNVEEPPPEPWVPVRPFSERVIGRPSRCTLPFLGTTAYFDGGPERIPSGRSWMEELLFLHWIKPRLPWSAFPPLGDCGEVGVHNPIPPFLEDLCVVRNLLRGGPLLWGYFSPERVRAAVEIIDLVSARRLMMTWGCFLKILPCLLSMPLGRAVVKGRPTLRMMQNRPLRIPSLVGEKVAIGRTDPLCR